MRARFVASQKQYPWEHMLYVSEGVNERVASRMNVRVYVQKNVLTFIFSVFFSKIMFFFLSSNLFSFVLLIYSLIVLHFNIQKFRPLLLFLIKKLNVRKCRKALTFPQTKKLNNSSCYFI